jgi:hypothetical protein
MDHTSEEFLTVFRHVHDLMGQGRVDEFVAFMHAEIEYIVNVDGQQVPYVMSALGCEDLRARLNMLFDTFEVLDYNILDIVPDRDRVTTFVHGKYRHKRTGETLDIRFMIRVWCNDDGLVTRIEEIHDAPYLEAFQRFTIFLESAASSG